MLWPPKQMAHFPDFLTLPCDKLWQKKGPLLSNLGPSPILQHKLLNLSHTATTTNNLTQLGFLSEIIGSVWALPRPGFNWFPSGRSPIVTTEHVQSWLALVSACPHQSNWCGHSYNAINHLYRSFAKQSHITGQVMCSFLTKMAEFWTKEREEELSNMWEVQLFLYDPATKPHADRAKTLLAKKRRCNCKTTDKAAATFLFLVHVGIVCTQLVQYGFRSSFGNTH